MLLCIGGAVNFFIFMMSLPGGPGNQQQIDWFEVLTSPAPAYLPWKIIVAIYIFGSILTIIGLIAKSKKQKNQILPANLGLGYSY
jgi:hypothetical protein